MATSSIFSTPMFTTDRAARSLADAIEASEREQTRPVAAQAQSQQASVRELTDRREVVEVVEKIAL